VKSAGFLRIDFPDRKGGSAAKANVVMGHEDLFQIEKSRNRGWADVAQ
jgi:hypothetical protein